MSAQDQQKKCAEGFGAFIQRRRAELQQSIRQKEQTGAQLRSEYVRCRKERPCTCEQEKRVSERMDREIGEDHKRLENLSADNARARAIHRRDCRIAAGRQQASRPEATQQRPQTAQVGTRIRRVPKLGGR